MPVVSFLAGLVLLSLGSDVVVRLGSRLADRFGVSPMVVGVTIVAVGTSAPELAIGITSALEGTGSLAVGNVSGTNVVNILLVLGLSALLDPLRIEPSTIRLGLPAIIGSALLLVVLAWDHSLGRVEGVVLLAGAVVYLGAIIERARRSATSSDDDVGDSVGDGDGDGDSGDGTDGSGDGDGDGADGSSGDGDAAGGAAGEHRTRKAVLDLVAVCLGIAVVVLGAELLVDGAVEIAQRFGVSDAFIGLTVVAVGTSAPELATTVVATLRRNRDLAVGNLLGSSVSNILIILGATLVVTSEPIALDDGLARVDIPLMAAVMLALVPTFVTGRRVSRAEGAAFLVAYLLYVTYLVVTQT